MHTSTELTIRTDRNNRETLTSVHGRVTIDTSPELREQLLAILQNGNVSRLTISLEDVPYIDCSGLATLVEALRIARKRSLELELSGLHDRVLYLLEVTGLLSLFQQQGRKHLRSARVTQ